MTMRDDRTGTPEHEREARDDGEDLGAENEHGDSAPAPFAPHEEDDTPLGDTDQHSDA
jgi:hypothetical protein